MDKFLVWNKKRSIQQWLFYLQFQFMFFFLYIAMREWVSHRVDPICIFTEKIVANIYINPELIKAFVLVFDVLFFNWVFSVLLFRICALITEFSKAVGITFTKKNFKFKVKSNKTKMIASPTVAKKCESPLKKLRKLFRSNSGSKGSYELEPDSYFNYNDDGRQSPQLYPSNNTVRHRLNLLNKSA